MLYQIRAAESTESKNCLIVIEQSYELHMSSSNTVQQKLDYLNSLESRITKT